MGADLIVYIVKGPRQLIANGVESDIQQAKEAVIDRAMDIFIERLRTLCFCVWKADGRDEAEFSETTFLRCDELCDKVAEVLAVECDSVIDFSELLTDFAASTSRKEVCLAYCELWQEALDDLLSLWQDGYRDSSFREDPDDPTQLILVAGEMSWGDTPQGGGYIALAVAFVLCLTDSLGIR